MYHPFHAKCNTAAMIDIEYQTQFSVVDATLVGITLPWPGQRYRKHIDSCYDHAQA